MLSINATAETPLGRQSRIGFGPSTCSKKVKNHQGKDGENEKLDENSQSWSDGSVYFGGFRNGRRHGHGEARWPNGEVYVGDFANDRKEGKGTYHWPNGSKFKGNFKADKRYGYGKLELPNGDVFEGFYIDDMRNGPGILTYVEDGAQDVGLWINEKICRICTSLEHSFTHKYFSRHCINAKWESTNITDNKVDDKKRKTKKTSDLSADWQNSDEILLTASKEFEYENIVGCLRSKFKPKGKLEKMSEKFIESSVKGDVLTIEKILRCGEIHPDVTDATGFGAMMAAAVNCHADVINCLLDYGANVNILNAEGLSPLAACHVLLYTDQDFVDNIAESLPKENTFNSAEWEKQRGCFVHRNDRKAILSMYGAFRTPSNENNKGKNGRKISLHSAQERSISTANDKIADMDPMNDSALAEDRNEENCNENWKLTYFQRTLSRGQELDVINQSFRKLKSRPFDTENVFEDLEPTPLSILAAERVAREVEKSGKVIDPRKGDISEDSIYCGESSFGNAPKIEIVAGDTKEKLLNAERKPHLKSTIKLLLDRGANPNSSSVPMPVIFYAVKAADIKACEALLAKGADTSIRLDAKHLGLAPLHIAVSLPLAEGVEITRLLLEANADPDIEDNAFKQSANGRTPLHIVCTREDNDKDAQKVAFHLLKHNANPDLLCQGHSPLSLAISSGNDLVVEALLKHNANPSLKLGKAVGSALCSAATFVAERRRQPSDRIKIIDKLVKAGADVLAPVHVVDRYPPGTVVDYAYHVFNQDRRIAHTPYHALSAHERACHNTRKEVLEHFGYLLRTAALKREKKMLEAELLNINETAARTSGNTEATKVVRHFDLETNAAVKRPAMKKESVKNYQREESRERSPNRDQNCGLPFAVVKSNDAKTVAALETNAANQRRLEAKRRFRYCYECGRLLGVRLAACTRCKEVFYCSKNCKVKAWNLRHKDECARISGRRSANAPDDTKRGIATPTTDAEFPPLLDGTPWKSADHASASAKNFGSRTKTSNSLSAKRLEITSSKVPSLKNGSIHKGSAKTLSQKARGSTELRNEVREIKS